MFPDIYRFTGLTLIVSSNHHFPKPEVTISLPRIAKIFVSGTKKNIFTRNGRETVESVTSLKTGSDVSKI